MRILVDLTDALSEWQEMLSDLQCTDEDLADSILCYNPSVDSLFIDSLLESENPELSDDVIEFIIRSTDTMMSERIDIYMASIGYEVSGIIGVVASSIHGSILAVIDAVPLMVVECHDVITSGSVPRVSRLATVSR